jgi:hypothetical protein
VGDNLGRIDNVAKKPEPSLDEMLQQEYNRWDYLYQYGGSDPFWEDGCNMGLVRNHIIYIKKQMEEVNQLTDIYYKELPPDIDRYYMAREDEIRADAKRSLEIYKRHEDYLYLLGSVRRLNKRQIEDTCINNVIGYVRGLEEYIKRDELVAMRRHNDPERYVSSFVDCRKRVEKIIGIKPIIIFCEDGKQLKGQMSITDWLTT